MASPATDTTRPAELSDDEKNGVDAALILLARCTHPAVTEIHGRLDGLRHPDPERSVMEKFDARVVELRKADPTLTRTAAHERIRRTEPELMREVGRASFPNRR
jgi:hypothetical protein